MNYRTIEDLDRAIVRNLSRIPRDIDVVVGVPRSGLLAANIVALHLNLPLADVEGFKNGRLLSGGHRTIISNRTIDYTNIRKALVIDDSLCTGREMKNVRKQLADIVSIQVLYGAVFVAPEREKDVDLPFETCELPRVFEWNVMHHPVLPDVCMDIDGVLCCDPTSEENDDGESYKRFLTTARPLHLPTLPVGKLVTCRLEKYRKPTEEWLHCHGVRYDELVMLDLPSKKDRVRLGGHGRFKGEVYRRSKSVLFIESSLQQAIEIADIACKPVLCIENNAIIYPEPATIVKTKAAQLAEKIKRRARFATSRLGRLLLRAFSN